ncbi:MAG: phosphotransferase [Paracoccus sp. (in: a-proteobacteria)]
MLSMADNYLCQSDPGLPGLRLVLDTAAVSEFLGGNVTIEYLRYKRGINCITACRRADDGQWFTLRAVTSDRFGVYLERPKWQEHAIWHHALYIVALPAGRDRDIPAARHLRNADQSGLLRFKPGRRFVLCEGDTLLRATTPDRFTQTLAGACFGATASGPVVLESNPENATFRTRYLPGIPADHMASPALYRYIGARLAEFHCQPAAGLTQPDPARLITQGARALRDLSMILPDEKMRCDTLAARLEAHLAAFRPDMAPCHGDFSADQVIVSPADDLHIIDWDHAHHGDRLRDVASFMAQVDLDGGADASELGKAFLQGYGISEEEIRIRRADALAARIAEPFRKRNTKNYDPNWPQACISILDQIEVLLKPLGIPALEHARNTNRIGARLGQNLRSATCLRLKPGRHAVLRYDGPGFTAFGKLRFGRPDLQTPAIHRALRNAGLDGRDSVHVPAVLDIHDGTALWLQEAASGTELTSLLKHDPVHPAIYAAGEALARLHHCNIDTNRNWTPVQEAGVMQCALDKAGRNTPCDLPRITRLYQVLQADLELLATPGPPVLLHRDFYPDQLIWSGSGIWILDLDLAAMGDAIVDIGNFLAHLDELALRRFGQLSSMEKAAAQFLEGYRAKAPLPDMTRIAAARRISLARHIHICRRFPDRAHEAPLIMDAILRAPVPV